MNEQLPIRHYQDGDAAALRTVFDAAVRELGPRDYTPAQVEAWADRGPGEAAIHARCTDGRTTLVCLDAAGEIGAYMDLEADGHIDHLYCRPELAGRGAASVLYMEVESLARDLRLPRLYVEASEAARRFFLRKGFKVLKRRSLTIEGVAIHNYAMEKQLL